MANGGRIGFQSGLNFDKAIEKMLEKENKDLIEKYKDAKGKFVKPSDHAPLVAAFNWSN